MGVCLDKLGEGFDETLGDELGNELDMAKD